MAYIIIFCLAVLCSISVSDAMLKCYTCSVGQGDLDQRCVTDPANVEAGSPITNCNKKYCISTRQEYKDPKGKVASMSRDCVDKPNFINQVHEDDTYRIYYVACQSPLCNGGSGRDITGGGLIADVGAVGNLLVKGIGDSGVSLKVTQSMLVLTFLTVLYLNC